MLSSEQFLAKSEAVSTASSGLAIGIIEKGRQRLSRELAHLTDEELVSRAADSGVPKEDLPTIAEQGFSEADRDQIIFKIFYIGLGFGRK